MKYLIALVMLCIGTLCHASNSVPVLMFHNISDVSQPSRDAMTWDTFISTIDAIKDAGYDTITVTELAAHLTSGTKLPKKTIVLTFDDGWKSHVVAASLLAERDMTGTFYVITGAFDDPQYVSRYDVANIYERYNVEIGAHTHTHFMKWESDMNALPDVVVRDELALSKNILEQLINHPITTIAWPFGYYRPDWMPMAAGMGYTSTVHVNSVGNNTGATSPSYIKRINVDGRCSTLDLMTMIHSMREMVCNK